MEIWAVVLENKDESGGEVKKVGFVASNLINQIKPFKEEAKSWQRVIVSKVEIKSNSEVLLNYVIDCLMK